MEEKIIDLSQSVHDICERYPEVKQLMIMLGFTDIKRPGMLQTAGRFMTLPKGAKMKGIDMETIKEELKKMGFKIKE